MSTATHTYRTTRDESALAFVADVNADAGRFYVIRSRDFTPSTTVVISYDDERLEYLGA